MMTVFLSCYLPSFFYFSLDDNVNDNDDDNDEMSMRVMNKVEVLKELSF